MDLKGVAPHLAGELHGRNTGFESVSINSRTLEPGDLFIAIKGNNFDGNDFVEDAAEKGACAAIVSRRADNALPQLLVEDTSRALGTLALLNRQRSRATLIGITGSQGKTTVKEMTGRILEQVGSTLTTTGNLNNTIGVPLTLLRLNRQHEFGVVEMGANRAGEIAYSVNLVMPMVATITRAAHAHIEGFGSLEGVARAKGEIIDGIVPTGTVVLNLDDAYFKAWQARAEGRRIVTFSTSDSAADYFASDEQRHDDGSQSFLLHADGRHKAVRLALLGRHNVMNAVVASALAIEAGAGLDQVKAGLESIRPVKGRLYPVDSPGGGGLIDDSYNASPESFKAAVDVLREIDSHRILLVGDMAELGGSTSAAHEELGRYARECGINELWSVGESSRYSTRTFGENGRHFSSRRDAIEYARKRIGPGVTLLIKGSRSAGLDEIVQELSKGRVS